MSFNNKLHGAIFGFAIGDALGLGTEFMSHQEARYRYPEGLTQYSQIISDAHRSLWKHGQYTHDTEILLLMARSLTECSGPDHLRFAADLKDWYKAHAEQLDTDSHMRWVLQHDDYAERPHEVCHEVYQNRGLFEAPNEALGRSMLAGMWPGSYETIEKGVSDNCRLTHWDSRCVSSSVVIAMMAHDLLWHRRETPYDQLEGICRRIDHRTLPYLETARNGSLEDFELDDEDTYWYTRKTMGAALWCLWHHKIPEEALYDVITYGGDANANAALTLALMGLKYGYTKLPQTLADNLIGHEEISDTVHQFRDALLEADATFSDTDEL